MADLEACEHRAGWIVAAFPEVPTYIEQGFNVTIANYRQVLAPKGTPPEVINTLYAAFKKAVASEKFQSFMNKSASIPLDWGPEKSRQFLTKQDESFKKLIIEMGLDKKKKKK